MILIATCAEYPHPTPNLAAMMQSLSAMGAEVAHRPWKTTALEVFTSAEAVLPLCCWDYYDDPVRFLSWIGALEAKGTTLINPPAILRWNFRKTYLLDLAAAGLIVPPTFHLPEVSREAIEDRMEREGWKTAVLKPVSGQGGYGILKLARKDAAHWPLETVRGEALLQEYQDDVGVLGETTLTFIDGQFSHAVRRILQAGEWRANPQFGITYERVDVSPNVIETARASLTCLPERPLYARVDGLIRPGSFMLMELELIDPYLYLEFAPGSADALARVILARIRS